MLVKVSVRATFKQKKARITTVSIIKMEMEPSKWANLGSYPLKCGEICHLSVLYHSKLKFFKYDINAWKYGVPADWNMWRRMKEAGVRIGFIDRVVGKHYLERNQMRD